MDVSSKVEYIEDNYTIDTTELGKVLVVASVSLLFLSAHAAITFNESSQDIEELNRNFDQVSGIMEGDQFQQSYEAIQTTSSTEVGGQFEQALDAYQQANQTVSQLDEVQESQEEKYRLYQWLVLISIIGMSLGAALIFV